jgi:hypothetical protein
MKRPKFIDHIQGPALTPKQRENAQSALQEIQRITKGKKIIFVYAKEQKRDQCAT